MSTSTDLKEVVREKYAQAASLVQKGGTSCCGTAPSLASCCDPITSNLYDATQAGEVPEEALKASLGCGNPTALAELKPGDVVPDRPHSRNRRRVREIGASPRIASRRAWFSRTRCGRRSRPGARPNWCALARSPVPPCPTTWSGRRCSSRATAAVSSPARPSSSTAAGS